MENSEKPGPLDGVRVLDLGHYIAIPILTRMMADLGAEIIKIEAAPHGDLTRFTPIIKNGYSGSFIQHNRGKQSVCVDLKTPVGADIVRDLARSVDVITENYSPGVLPRYGLGYEDFRKVNQRVIMLSISGFGQDGPLKHRVGNDTVALAMSGLMHLTGDPDGPPYTSGFSSPTKTPACMDSRQFAPRFTIARRPESASTSTCHCSNACSICTTRRSSFM